jgi:hypothetical protein
MLSRARVLQCFVLRNMANQSAKEFLNYVNASPSPYHAVAESVKLLEAANYKKVSEVILILFKKILIMIFIRKTHGM